MDTESGRARRRRRWPWVVLAGIVVVLAGATGWAVATYPTVAAVACPGCYGMARVDESVYLERAASPAERERVVDVLRQADRRLRDAYQGRRSSPRILACLTGRCYERIGGGAERGVAVLDRAVMLSPRGINPVIAAHEQSHVELHHRLDSPDEVPQWFDEGLAVLVADDRRYVGPPSAPDRCRDQPSGQPPVSLDAWLRAASDDPRVYARAACRTHRLLDEYGGRSAIPELIRRLNDGEPFAASGSTSTRGGPVVAPQGPPGFRQPESPGTRRVVTDAPTPEYGLSFSP